MNHLHWMKLYIGDELSNTSHMTPAEFGSYIFLKMHYWRFGCLPTDDERLARIAKVSAEQWAEIKPSIGPLFEDDWRDPKLEAQRTEAEEKHLARVEAGKKGGRPRSPEKQSYKHSFSKTKAGPKQPEPDPEPDPYSDLAPARDPDTPAFEKNNKGTYTRGRMFDPYLRPTTAAEGKRFLYGLGVPEHEVPKHLDSLMTGELRPFDIEEWISQPTRGAA